jgi:hypothetical protein
MVPADREDGDAGVPLPPASAAIAAVAAPPAAAEMIIIFLDDFSMATLL